MTIRPINANEIGFLEEMLYETLFVEEGDIKLPKSILYESALSRYFNNFGKGVFDICYVAEINEMLIGAIWGRRFSEAEKGYGFIHAHSPELSMAIKKSYRNRGIGTALMHQVLVTYKAIDVTSVSLSVHKKNTAFKLYTALGFKIVVDNKKSVIMKKDI